MNRSPSKLTFPKNRVVNAMAVLAALTQMAVAADYTWDGTSNFWNSAHWLPGPVVGPTLSTDTATIDSGVVTFSINDSFGNAGTVASPQITINNGGTLASGGKFNTMWNLAINGGTLLANGGVNNPFGAFGLKGTVTIGGTSVSTIAVGGVNGFETISLGHGANSFTTFNVADASICIGAGLLMIDMFLSKRNERSDVRDQNKENSPVAADN